VLVPDVDALPGHIACGPKSRSELVAPLLRGRTLPRVLDLDSSLPTDNELLAVWPTERCNVVPEQTQSGLNPVRKGSVAHHVLLWS
jgi:hypothetical protein